MEFSNPELFEAFYLMKKYEYPHLSFEQFKEIVSTPWLYTKQQMESGELPQIKLKFFGKFKVYPKKAMFELSQLDERLEKNLITPEQHKEFKEMIEKYLNIK
jgi:tRNA-dihydrouridine synthase